MRATILLFIFFFCISLFASACSSSTQTKEANEAGEEVAEKPGEPSLVEACRKAATEATSLVDALENSPADDLSFDDYREMAAAHARWNAENHPCLAEGPDVTERARTASGIREKLATAEEDYVASKVMSLVNDARIDEARELLMIRFQQGRKVGTRLQEASYAMSKAYGAALNDAFRKSGKSAQFGDDLETTCLFSRQEFDPKTTPVETHHASVFGGKGVVHALCRLPLSASKYTGDPNGEVKLIIDTDDDDDNGVLAETNLGAIAKYRDARYFRGRFPIPQGINSEELSAYYHIRVKLERPEMGDESPVGNGFWWFADE